MHPGFYGWWKHAHGHGRHQCGGECSPGAEGGPPWARHRGHCPGPDARFCGFDDDASAGFGVRRPLRFLAHKLDLTEAQVGELATILNELKTERAQASVDNRRRIGSLAEALEGDAFDADKVKGVGSEQTKTEERLQAAIGKALGDQR